MQPDIAYLHNFKLLTMLYSNSLSLNYLKLQQTCMKIIMGKRHKTFISSLVSC